MDENKTKRHPHTTLNLEHDHSKLRHAPADKTRQKNIRSFRCLTSLFVICAVFLVLILIFLLGIVVYHQTSKDVCPKILPESCSSFQTYNHFYEVCFDPIQSYAELLANAESTRRHLAGKEILNKAALQLLNEKISNYSLLNTASSVDVKYVWINGYVNLSESNQKMMQFDDETVLPPEEENILCPSWYDPAESKIVDKNSMDKRVIIPLVVKVKYFEEPGQEYSIISSCVSLFPEDVVEAYVLFSKVQNRRSEANVLTARKESTPSGTISSPLIIDQTSTQTDKPLNQAKSIVDKSTEASPTMNVSATNVNISSNTTNEKTTETNSTTATTADLELTAAVQPTVDKILSSRIPKTRSRRSILAFGDYLGVVTLPTPTEHEIYVEPKPSTQLTMASESCQSKNGYLLSASELFLADALTSIDDSLLTLLLNTPVESNTMQYLWTDFFYDTQASVFQSHSKPVDLQGLKQLDNNIKRVWCKSSGAFDADRTALMSRIKASSQKPGVATTDKVPVIIVLTGDANVRNCLMFGDESSLNSKFSHRIYPACQSRVLNLKQINNNVLMLNDKEYYFPLFINRRQTFRESEKFCKTLKNKDGSPAQLIYTITREPSYFQEVIENLAEIARILPWDTENKNGEKLIWTGAWFNLSYPSLDESLVLRLSNRETRPDLSALSGVHGGENAWCKDEEDYKKVIERKWNLVQKTIGKESKSDYLVNIVFRYVHGEKLLCLKLFDENLELTSSGNNFFKPFVACQVDFLKESKFFLGSKFYVPAMFPQKVSYKNAEPECQTINKAPYRSPSIASFNSEDYKDMDNLLGRELALNTMNDPGLVLWAGAYFDLSSTSPYLVRFVNGESFDLKKVNDLKLWCSNEPPVETVIKETLGKIDEYKKHYSVKVPIIRRPMEGNFTWTNARSCLSPFTKDLSWPNRTIFRTYCLADTEIIRYEDYRNRAVPLFTTDRNIFKHDIYNEGVSIANPKMFAQILTYITQNIYPDIIHPVLVVHGSAVPYPYVDPICRILVNDKNQRGQPIGKTLLSSGNVQNRWNHIVSLSNSIFVTGAYFDFASDKEPKRLLWTSENKKEPIKGDLEQDIKLPLCPSSIGHAALIDKAYNDFQNWQRETNDLTIGSNLVHVVVKKINNQNACIELDFRGLYLPKTVTYSLACQFPN